MSSSSAVLSDDLAASVADISRAVDAAINAGDAASISDATLQALVTTASRLYAARVEQSGFVPATAPGALNATQGMIVCTGLLRAVNVQLFELGLWQSW